MARVGVARSADHDARPARAAASGADVDCGGADHLAAGQPTADSAAQAARARGHRATSRAKRRSICRASSARRQEIQELRDAFARAVARVDESEREMAGALEGQRRLVREVHHRVKNNLQVVASLLNIHGRSAETPRSALGLCRDQPPSRRAVDRPPQPFRGDGGESRDRAAAADYRARCRAARRRAGGSARPEHRSRARHASTRPRTSRSRSPS